MSSEKPKAVQVTVEIDWVYPIDLVTRYANNMQVQVTQDECILSFFDVPPPAMPTDPTAREAFLKSNQELKVKGSCVSRIAIPLTKIEKFADAFQKVRGLRADISGVETTAEGQASGH